MTNDPCGHETADGTPCENPGSEPDGKCWMHTGADDDADVGRKSELEKNPDLIDRVADRLAAKDTVAEACAEIPGLSERQYYEWRRRAEDDGGVFRKFREETTRARKGAGRQDRTELKNELREQGDTRTWYKLHMKQYGDQYGGEDMDMRENEGVRQNIPEDLVTEWYERHD